MKNHIEKKMQLKNVPTFLKENFSIDERMAMGLMESVNIQQQVLAEQVGRIHIDIIEAKEDSGVIDEDGNDVHGKTKKCVRVGLPGSYEFVLMHMNPEGNDSWKVVGEKE